MGKKDWYVVTSSKGLFIYQHCKNKADAEKLKRQLNSLFPTNTILFFVDFCWKKDTATEKQKHGRGYTQTFDIIGECEKYLTFYAMV